MNSTGILQCKNGTFSYLWSLPPFLLTDSRSFHLPIFHAGTGQCYRLSDLHVGDQTRKRRRETCDIILRILPGVLITLLCVAMRTLCMALKTPCIALSTLYMALMALHDVSRTLRDVLITVYIALKTIHVALRTSCIALTTLHDVLRTCVLH